MHTSSEFSSEPRSTGEFLRRIVVYLKPYALGGIGNILFAFLTIAFYFVFPYVMQYIIDTVIGGRRMDLLLPAAACLAGAFLLCELCNALRILINTRFGQNVIYDMRRDVYGRMQRLPVTFFDHRSSGDLMTRIIDDVASVHRILIDGIERAATTFLSILVVFVILVSKNLMLTMLALIPLTILIAGTLWYSLTAHRRYRRQREAIGEMNSLLMDNLQGIRQIKAFGRQSHEDERFRQKADRLRITTFGVMKVWAAYSPAMTLAGSFGMVLALGAGGPMVVHGEMTLGELVAFLFYITLFYQPVGRLDGLNQMLQAARTASDRVFDIFDAAAENEGRSRPSVIRTPVRGDVRYNKVFFAYDNGIPVLSDISLHARPGQTIALVGPTGSGKTTLVNLLPAFYEAVSGQVLIDGQDISMLSLGSLRSCISIVSQESFLFNGTIRENILYGRLNASQQDMIRASQAANCHAFIMSLPDGYDSLVGERGVKLSVGEKQRISVARALLKNAPILILDEATASVDTVTEGLIQEALSRLMADRTSFVIAHRLNTIRNADEILVMHHGEIIERGKHRELISLNGMYARLSAIQSMERAETGNLQIA